MSAEQLVSVIETEKIANDSEAMYSPRLMIYTPSGELYREVALNAGSYTIGRTPANDIVLVNDKLTSRKHAMISVQEGQYILTDTGSSNGTFVNGKMLEQTEERALLPGDVVNIGEYELAFRTDGSPAASESQLSERANTKSTRILAETRDQRPDPDNIDGRQYPTVDASEKIMTGDMKPLPSITPLLETMLELEKQLQGLQDQFVHTQTEMNEFQQSAYGSVQQMQRRIDRVRNQLHGSLTDVQQDIQSEQVLSLSILIQDVMTNPRDIEYVTSFARKAHDIYNMLQGYQQLIESMTQCEQMLGNYTEAH